MQNIKTKITNHELLQGVKENQKSRLYFDSSCINGSLIEQPFDNKLKPSLCDDCTIAKYCSANKSIVENIPDVEFYHEFADEGGGFVGYQVIKNGKLIDYCDYDWDEEAGIEVRQNVGYYYEDEEDDSEEEFE